MHQMVFIDYSLRAMDVTVTTHGSVLHSALCLCAPGGSYRWGVETGGWGGIAVRRCAIQYVNISGFGMKLIYRLSACKTYKQQICWVISLFQMLDLQCWDKGWVVLPQKRKKKQHWVNTCELFAVLQKQLK